MGGRDVDEEDIEEGVEAEVCGGSDGDDHDAPEDK